MNAGGYIGLIGGGAAGAYAGAEIDGPDGDGTMTLVGAVIGGSLGMMLGSGAVSPGEMMQAASDARVGETIAEGIADRNRRQMELDQLRAAAEQETADKQAAQQRAAAEERAERQRQADQQQQMASASAEQQRASSAEAEQQRQAEAEAQRAREQEQARRAEADRQREAEQKRLADAKAAEQRQAEAERARLAEQQRQVEEERARRRADNSSGNFSTVGLAPIQQGATPPGSGTLSNSISHIGGCAARSISVRYSLSSLLGDAVVGGSWSWEGEQGCTPPPSTKVWLRLQSGSAYGYVALDPAVPQAGRGFGYTSPGSPPWSQLVCGFTGGSPAGCMDAESARRMWAHGEVVGFEVGW